MVGSTFAPPSTTVVRAESESSLMTCGSPGAGEAAADTAGSKATAKAAPAARNMNGLPAELFIFAPNLARRGTIATAIPKI